MNVVVLSDAEHVILADIVEKLKFEQLDRTDLDVLKAQAELLLAIEERNRDKLSWD